jgi:hypothetical protein
MSIDVADSQHTTRATSLPLFLVAFSSHCFVAYHINDTTIMRFSTAAALLLSTSAVYGFVPASQPASFSTSLFSTTEAATAKKVRQRLRDPIIKEEVVFSWTGRNLF